MATTNRELTISRSGVPVDVGNGIFSAPFSFRLRPGAPGSSFHVHL